MRKHQARFTALSFVIAWALGFAFHASSLEGQSVDPLTRGIEAALDGRDPGPAWREFCNARVQRLGERGSPSANWPTLACGTAYILGEPWAAGWWRRYLREAEAEHRLWGKEPGSTIYRSWMVLPVMVVRDQANQRGDQVTRDLADRWLRASWAIQVLGACPAPERTSISTKRRWARVSTTLIGARSYSRRMRSDGARLGPPHHWDRNHLTMTLSRALGWRSAESGWSSWEERVEKRLAAPAPARYGLRSSERDILRRHVIAGDRLDSIVPWLFGSVAGIEVRRYEHGAASIMWQARGSMATAPIYAAVCDHQGNREFAAPDPGNRHDILPGIASAEGRWIRTQRGDGTVSSLAWPPAHPGRVKLPEGRLLYAVEVGPRGVRVLEPLTSEKDVPSIPPETTDDSEIAIDWPQLLRVARALVRQSLAENPVKARRRVLDASRILKMTEEAELAEAHGNRTHPPNRRGPEQRF